MAENISLPARVDLPAASLLAADLKQKSGDVVIDASAVTHFGALGLQTLVAASRHAKANGHSLTVQDPSERFLEHLTTMGVSPEQLMEGTI